MAFNDSKDGVNFTSLSATPASFVLMGGRYAFGIHATFGGGNVVLQILMPDNSTFVSCGTALTADGFEVFDLPAGTYQIAITTATGVEGFLQRVPYYPSF